MSTKLFYCAQISAYVYLSAWVTWATLPYLMAAWRWMQL